MNKDKLIEFAKGESRVFPEDSAMGWYLRETLKMLQESPCEDAISREDVIKAVDRHTFNTDDGLCLDEDISIILEEEVAPKQEPTLENVITNKIKAQEKYEKDFNDLKEHILKEGDNLLTKRELLERFCEIDKEYNGRSWNLLQILTNINVLIGQEPCEDVDACKKGKWIEVDTNMYTCSNCSHCFEIVPEVNHIQQFKCCPNCKTEMEGEE